MASSPTSAPPNGSPRRPPPPARHRLRHPRRPHPAERLLAERAELRALLHHRPHDRHPAFYRAERALEYAKKELYWAQHRLDHAQEHLEQFGPLSQLRRHGRQEKASTADQIDRFTNDIRNAEAKIASCEQTLEELRPELGQRLQWDVDHNFPDSRLRTIDAELAESTSRPTKASPGTDRCSAEHRRRTSRPGSIGSPKSTGHPFRARTRAQASTSGSDLHSRSTRPPHSAAPPTRRPPTASGRGSRTAWSAHDREAHRVSRDETPIPRVVHQLQGPQPAARLYRLLHYVK